MLTGLLNSLIEGREIKDVTFLNTEIHPDAYDGKKSIIDILCTDTDITSFTGLTPEQIEAL